jgi:hypothetical protein
MPFVKIRDMFRTKFLYLCINNFRIKWYKASLSKYAFTELWYKGFVRKLLKEEEEVGFRYFIYPKEDLSLYLLLKVIFKGLKGTDIARL